ncbi:type 1 glutamine amidotransferase [Stutzerimonas azotifigens]|uniref:type 1 glutamine amidotransferase n=1 Tax=Stutzerimonas azotifigens TaxID=291995 RepID=UPI000426A8F3|nr:type 1 glutamine amidotransferase [Stutzerimonas azotifigens]
MRIAILRNAAFSGPGRIGDWLAWRGLPARIHPLYEDAALPALDDFDLLLILGGTAEADDAGYPWLEAEGELIRAALADGKRLLGIGLGARLLAEALGARRRLESAGIGWLALELAAQAKRSPLGRMLPQRLLAPHWYREGFELPAGAVPLYTSARGACQGFIWNERAIGLQCHLESTPDCLEALRQASGEAPLRNEAAQVPDCRMSLYRILDYVSGPHALLR